MPKFMPPPTSQSDESAELSEDPHADGVNSLLSLLRDVANSGGFRKVQAAIQENSALRNRVTSLEIAFEESAGAVGKKQVDIDRIREEQEQERVIHQALQHDLDTERASSTNQASQIKAQGEKLNDLIAQIKTNEKRLENLRNIEKTNKNLEDRLATCEKSLELTKKTLAEASRDLKASRLLSVPLGTLHHEGSKVYDLLDQMFQLAFRLLGGWLQADLDEGSLLNVGRWEALREHHSIERSMPLPLSNSAPAKSMRVAAGLSVYARALARHVMKPTYLLQDNDALRALVDLARHNQSQSAYLRAVLLRSFPEEHKAMRQGQTDMVVKEVVGAIGWYAKRKEGGSFQASLEEVTVKIANSWERIQTLEETVTPSFQTDFAGDWTPLPIQAVASASAAVGNSQKKEQTPTNGREGMGGALILQPIWPSFLCIGSKDSADELLRPGYGLTDGQMEKAREELSRRAQRKSARQAGPISRQKRDSGIFLSAGGSNGLGDE